MMEESEVPETNVTEYFVVRLGKKREQGRYATRTGNAVSRVLAERFYWAHHAAGWMQKNVPGPARVVKVKRS